MHEFLLRVLAKGRPPAPPNEERLRGDGWWWRKNPPGSKQPWSRVRPANPDGRPAAHRDPGVVAGRHAHALQEMAEEARAAGLHDHADRLDELHRRLVGKVDTKAATDLLHSVRMRHMKAGQHPDDMFGNLDRQWEGIAKRFDLDGADQKLLEHLRASGLDRETLLAGLQTGAVPELAGKVVAEAVGPDGRRVEVPLNQPLPGWAADRVTLDDVHRGIVRAQRQLTEAHIAGMRAKGRAKWKDEMQALFRRKGR